MPRLSHPSWFDQPNNIWWRVHIWSSPLCNILQPPATSSIFDTNYSTHHPVLKHHQCLFFPYTNNLSVDRMDISHFCTVTHCVVKWCSMAGGWGDGSGDFVMSSLVHCASSWSSRCSCTAGPSFSPDHHLCTWVPSWLRVFPHRVPLDACQTARPCPFHSLCGIFTLFW
jgi:hypothetical protein